MQGAFAQEVGASGNFQKVIARLLVAEQGFGFQTEFCVISAGGQQEARARCWLAFERFGHQVLQALEAGFVHGSEPVVSVASDRSRVISALAVRLFVRHPTQVAGDDGQKLLSRMGDAAAPARWQTGYVLGCVGAHGRRERNNFRRGIIAIMYKQQKHFRGKCFSFGLLSLRLGTSECPFVQPTCHRCLMCDYETRETSSGIMIFIAASKWQGGYVPSEGNLPRLSGRMMPRRAGAVVGFS